MDADGSHALFMGISGLGSGVLTSVIALSRI